MRSYLLYRKFALGERACFVKNSRLRVRERFHIVSALYQHALARSTAYTAEKAERYGNYQRAWAGYYEEIQRTHYPLGKAAAACQRGYECQQYRARNYRRGVYARKFRDEILGTRFFR